VFILVAIALKGVQNMVHVLVENPKELIRFDIFKVNFIAIFKKFMSYLYILLEYFV
jgi:hypothetical protein